VTAHTPSRACYQRGCRLPECVRANGRYEKALNLEHARGHRRQIDAQQTRVHIERLRAADWSNPAIAQAAGVARSTIDSLTKGQREVRSWVALAILSIPVGPPPAPSGIDATGSIRRLRALAVLGHPFRTVAAIVGCSNDKLERIANGWFDTINPGTAAGITRAYKRLCSVPGTSPHSRSRAERRGWHGPLAWDDIDDPNCQPEQAAPYEAVSKYERDPDKTAEIEHLYLLGESLEQIAKQLGGNEKYIRDQLGAILRRRAQRAEQERAVKAGLERAA
jgi:hypothetical protein